jgi:hypothetical protein
MGILRSAFMNTIGMGILVIGGATYLAVAGALAFRRLRKKVSANEEQFQSMADPMLNVVATLFSILLGFLVAGAMDKYNSTQEQCETEALKLADVYSLARGIDDKNKKILQDSCREYCQIMINEEWPKMAEQKTSPHIWPVSLKIWDVALAYQPSSNREVDIHESLLEAVRELGEARRSRIVAMRERLSPALWIVVIGGSIILMACTYMFFVENPKLQGLMIALVALSLSLNVLLLAIYSNPFSGDLKIQPEAFELDAQIFSHVPPPLKLDPVPVKSKGDEDD